MNPADTSARGKEPPDDDGHVVFRAPLACEDDEAAASFPRGAAALHSGSELGR